MARKIAIAIVHGIGAPPPDFADGMIADLKARFNSATGTEADAALAFQPIYWSPILRPAEEELWRRITRTEELHYTALRRFLVGFAGNVLAYQPAVREKEKYVEVHAAYAQGLRQLAGRAGRAAPLVVIAHSLGAVITCNFFHDLARRNRSVTTRLRAALNPAARSGPLEQGETLACLFTLGCPLILWSLRYEDYGRPLPVPPPQLARWHPGLASLAGWENYFDPEDILSYPLRTLNAAYAQAVKRDVPVHVGNLLTTWNPLSHRGYWTSAEVNGRVASRLAALWRA